MNIKVLVVDDSPTEMYKIVQMLNKHNFSIYEAENGEDAIEIAKKELPDVILMDVVMPGLNGFQATRQIVKEPETQNIPIIMITTKDQETDKIWGMRQGASVYLTKPVEEKALLEAIKSVVAN